MIRIELSAQEGSPKKLTCKFIKPVAKQLKKFTASGYNLPQFEDGFWKPFDWNNTKSLSMWPDNYQKAWHIPDDLIEYLKTIPEDRVVLIKNEGYDLSNIPDGKINLYKTFRYDCLSYFDNADEIPEYMITTEKMLNK